ncbi:MAG TPA: ABC transporter substrate-binding protein [Bacteroidetes bacterium]|nr:ABC transporter substrate-binding protein [Bacteroidota bacterium]
MNIFTRVGCIAIIALLNLSCSNQQKKLVFAVVPKLLDNPVFNVAKAGAEDAAKEFGDVEIYWTAPVTSDAAQQASIIESLIERKVDGIALSVNDPDALKSVIDKAVDAGIPVVTFDSDAPHSKRLSFYGTNSFEAGMTMADLLIERMGKKGKIAIQTGTPGALNLEERIQGVKEHLKAFPEISVATTQACYDDINKAVSQVEAVHQAHRDLNGWVMVGGWATFTPPPGPFADVKPGSVTVIAFDALQEQLDYVRQGYVQVLVAQKLWGWGYHSVSMLHGIIKEKKKYPDIIDSGVDIVTKDNVEEYAAKWKTMNFREPAVAQQ